MPYTKEEQIEIANTIIAQLGGRRFQVMTGASNFLALDSGVQFNIGAGAKSDINKVVVTLMPDDTYTVEFWRIKRRSLDITKVSDYVGVSADTLQRVFTEATGFYTHL